MDKEKMVYLDYNVFAYYFNSVISMDNEFKEFSREPTIPNLKEKIDSLKKIYKLPYSPAHMEDIASSIIKKPEDKKNIRLNYEKIKSIHTITDDLELYPGFDFPIFEKYEHPGHCMTRVLKSFNDINPFVEKQEKDMLSKFKLDDEDGEVSKSVSNIPIDILLRKEYKLRFYLQLEKDLIVFSKMRKLGLRKIKYPDIAKSHTLIERCLELAMNFLEEIRFKPEKITNTNSRMHDVSHAIYATKADYFISNDKRMVAKTRAVYKYFDIPTKVFSLKEFMKLNDLENMK